MRVGYLALGEYGDGMDAGVTHTLSICQGLAAQGHTVFLLIPNGSRLVIPGVFVVEVSLKSNLFQFFLELPKLRHILSLCDVVHERYTVAPWSLFLTFGLRHQPKT